MQDNSDLIIRDCCEAEAAEFGKPDTICITVDVLREIVQRHSPGPCLHQIQEPEADIWPCVNIDVDESGKITNAKLYSPGLPAGNHDVYPVRVPYMDEHTEAWLACAAELRKHLPEFMHLRDMNGIECAVAAIRELAERSAPGQAALPAMTAALFAASAPADHDDEDLIAVPRGLLGAARGAIARKADAPSLLEKLRRYTTGDLSAEAKRRVSSTAPAAAAPAVLPEPVAWSESLAALVAQVDAGSTADYRALQEHRVMRSARALLAQAATAAGSAAQAVKHGEVLVTVSGFTGSGKSAVAGEIEILCRALGLQVQWPDGDSEKNMTHADWTAALEQYKPRVRIVEQNIPFASKKGLSK